MRLLLVAFEYPPSRSIGAQRPYRWAGLLADLGHEVTVLTSCQQDVDGCSVWDEGNQRSGVRVVRVPCPAVSHPRGRLANYLRFWFFGAVDPWGKQWCKPVRSKWREVVEVARPEIVIVTVPFFSVAPIVLELAGSVGLPCIVDFRDAWSQWCTSLRMTWFHHRYILSLERKCLMSAARITGVTKQVLEDLIEQHPTVPRSKFVLVPNGTDAPLQPFKQERIGTGKYVIGYVGRFYYEPAGRNDCMCPFYQRPLHRWFQYIPRREDWKYRSPYFFFRALALLFERRPDLRDLVQVVFAGNAEDWLGNQIAEFGLEDVVTHVGRLGHSECLEFQRNCDALLLTSVKVLGGRDYCIAGKTFEYLLTGRPVIGFVTEGEQRDFLRGSGVGVICDPDDPEDASQKLGQAIEGKIDLRRNEQFLEGYTRLATVERNLLDCCTVLMSEINAE